MEGEKIMEEIPREELEFRKLQEKVKSLDPAHLGRLLNMDCFEPFIKGYLANALYDLFDNTISSEHDEMLDKWLLLEPMEVYNCGNI